VAREEITAYQTAMLEDPLLPKELIPHGYKGFDVFAMHKKFVREVRTHLKRRTTKHKQPRSTVQA